MTQVQAEALATLVTRLRPDWDHVGLMSVIGKARHMGTATQISRALLALCENRELRTPALLAEKGRHWQQDGEPIGPNGSHNIRCPEHSLSVMPCPECAAKKCPPPTSGEYAAARLSLAQRPRLTKQGTK